MFAHGAKGVEYLFLDLADGHGENFIFNANGYGTARIGDETGGGYLIGYHESWGL